VVLGARAGFTIQSSLPRVDALGEIASPPGENPFHVKGLVAGSFSAFVAGQVPGGMEAVLRGLEPELRDYFQQSFLAGSWYDLLALLKLMVKAAAVAGRPANRFIAEHGAWQAKRDIRTVHRLLLLIASPETVAPRMGVAFGRYFDFGAIELVGVQRGVLELDVRALPAALNAWYRVSVHSAADAILSTAGAKDVQSWYTPPEPDGKKHGVTLVRFGVRRTWTK